jgi:hypothetical protein
MGHPGFVAGQDRTADPSTALRSGRDDKGRGVTHLKVCESDRKIAKLGLLLGLEVFELFVERLSEA